MTTGAVLITKLNWLSVNDKSNPIAITDWVNISAHKSTEIKNNILNITLKNPPVLFDGTHVRGLHVNGSYDLNFNEEDQLTLYLILTNDASDIGSDIGIDANLIGEFVLEEYNTKTVENNSQITLKCVDRAFLLFNKVQNASFGVASIFTSPGIFRKICRSNSEAISDTITKYSGTNNDPGVEYALEANFVSEGGYIQDYRTESGAPDTKLDGALNDSDLTIPVLSTTGFKSIGTIVISDGTTSEHVSHTGITGTTFTGCTREIDDTKAVSHSDATEVYQGFPSMMMSKTWKALFDWFGDISETQYLNYSDERGEGNTPFYQRSFMLYVDKKNKMHWFSVNDGAADLTIALGDDDLKSFTLQRSVFDSINFVIFNCGSDMYGHGILYYWHDESTDLGNLKMRYEPMTDISDTMVNDDIVDYNSTRETGDTQDQLKQFPSAGSYPVSTWSFKDDSNQFRTDAGQAARTTLATDSAYNDSLREAAKQRGLAKAQHLTKKLAGLRYKGKLALSGQDLSPGDLIEVTNRFTGVVSKQLRVLDVLHQVNPSKYETIVDVEEDEKVVA